MVILRHGVFVIAEIHLLLEEVVSFQTVVMSISSGILDERGRCPVTKVLVWFVGDSLK